MAYIKKEPIDFEDYPNGPEGIQPSLDVQVPENFEREEWVNLTDVIITALYHIYMLISSGFRD
jgi:hypothetical protein